MQLSAISNNISTKLLKSINSLPLKFIHVEKVISGVPDLRVGLEFETRNYFGGDGKIFKYLPTQGGADGSVRHLLGKKQSCFPAVTRAVVSRLNDSRNPGNTAVWRPWQKMRYLLCVIVRKRACPRSPRSNQSKTCWHLPIRTGKARWITTHSPLLVMRCGLWGWEHCACSYFQYNPKALKIVQ